MELRTSQEKADRWFGGGRFWQIPGAFLEKDEWVVAAARRCLGELGQRRSGRWSTSIRSTTAEGGAPAARPDR